MGPNLGEGTQMSDRILKIWVTIENVTKFGDDWVSKFEDLAA